MMNFGLKNEKLKFCLCKIDVNSTSILIPIYRQRLWPSENSKKNNPLMKTATFLLIEEKNENLLDN